MSDAVEQDGDGDSSSGSWAEPASSPLWERILGLVGGLLLVAIVVLVATGDDSPAVVTTEITATRTESSMTIFEIDVRNEGGETVEDVMVVGELIDDDGEVVSTSDATVTFLPGGGREQVVLAFRQQSEIVDLSVAAVGWSDA